MVKPPSRGRGGGVGKLHTGLAGCSQFPFPQQKAQSFPLPDNTYMERRAISCIKVSALISWILLCWRPLTKQKLV